jgi:non-ribosomal peptide synthetase component F
VLWRGEHSRRPAGEANKIDELLEAEPHNTDRMLTAEERQRVLVEWNATAVPYPRDVCLHQLIVAQVERTPDAVAVVFGEKQLTYRELFAQAKKLAAELRKAGAAPDRLIGVCMERSLEMVVALVAILKAGAAYVPLDPEYPAERLSFMMQDAAVPMLLTQESLAATLPPHRAKVICVDLDAATVAPSGKSAGQPTAESLAYMIYTSGSTGRPKGALNTHRAIVNRLLWMQDEYRLTSEDAVLQKTPFSFDVSVWEFFWPLITGARLVVAEPGGHRDAAYSRHR